MNLTAIYSKTGKGVQEASGKTSVLSRGDRAILAAIDGKISLQQLSAKFDRRADESFYALIRKMDADGFIREVSPGTVQRGAANAPRTVPPKPTAKPAGGGGVEDLDFTQDALDWQRVTPEQQKGLLGVTIRFLAGEQAVTDELVPMLAASHALRRFDWTMFLATFLLEEAKHAEFFMRWHEAVVGIVDPGEVAPHFLMRGKKNRQT